MSWSITKRDTADGGIVLNLSGEVDYATAPKIRDAINEAIQRRPAYINIDVSQVTVLDSTGIGTIVVGYRIGRSDGVSITVINPSKFVSRLFTVVGASELLDDPRRDSFPVTIFLSHDDNAPDIQDALAVFLDECGIQLDDSGATNVVTEVLR